MTIPTELIGTVFELWIIAHDKGKHECIWKKAYEAKKRLDSYTRI